MINQLNKINIVNKLNGVGKYTLSEDSKLWKAYSDSSLTVVPASDTSITLTWTNPVIEGNTLRDVIVERSTDDVTFATVATLGAVETYTDTELTANTLYYYRLKFVSSRGIVTSVGAVVVSYSPRSKAYFDAMDVQLPSATKKVIDAAIVATEDIIAKMDCFMLSLATEQQSLLWLNDPTKTGVRVNSPTFTAYKGWNGDATNYINTGLNPGDGGTHNIKQNDASLFVYTNKTDVWNTHYIVGTASDLALGVYENKSFITKINYSSVTNTIFIGFSKEFLSGRRINQTGDISGINKEKIANTNEVSVEIKSKLIGISQNSYRCAMFGVGAYLTDQEFSDFQDVWLSVLEHLGSDYWSNYIPTTLSATGGAQKIDLAWTLPVVTYSPYTVTNVVIQESTDNVTFADILTLGAVTTRTIAVPTGETRYYKIRFISSRNIHTTNSSAVNATAM